MPEKTSIMNGGLEDVSLADGAGTGAGSGATLMTSGTADSAGRKSGGRAKPSSQA